ncbi:MAG: hypothetical protein LBQ64_04885, partial [Bacteroidales bacterium]|nr:hypothetical protein [Bacteroidales bacterium]
LVSINIRCLRHQFHPCGIFYACDNLKYTQHSVPDGTAAGILHSVFYQHFVPKGTGIAVFCFNIELFIWKIELFI